MYKKYSWKLGVPNRHIVKIGLIMRLTAVLLIATFMQVSAVGFAQKISISKSNAPLKTVLREIRSQTGYDFFITDALLKKAKPVNIKIEAMQLEKALDQIFDDQPLTYSIKSKTILIKAKVLSFMDRVMDVPAAIDVHGRVVDEKNQALPGASITVKGGTVGTSTDDKGIYKINVDENSVLVFQMLGYLKKEVAVKSKTSIDVVLIEDIKIMDEVVVIGYGTQKKRDLTGAVSSIKADNLVIASGPEVGNMLKGKLAGLTIRQNSAQPGGGLDILVRGAGSVNASNAPLFVVDGFPISDLQQPKGQGRYQQGTQSILNSFNPNDIESIEVLKDASATSIYGSRAANGVILITTKRGKDGVAKVEYATNFSMQKYNNPFDVLSLSEWMQVRNEAAKEQWTWDNGVIPYGTKTVAEAELNPINGSYRKLYSQNAINNVGRGTDWFELVTRDGFTNQHNLSVTGGTKSTKYLLSGNYYNQEGIIKNSGFRRYSLRANIDQELSKYVKLGISLTSSRIDNRNSQLGGDQYENSGIIRAAIQQGPHIQAIDENGNYPLNPQLALQPNPYSLLTISDEGRVERMLLNSFVDVTPVKDLVIKLKAGFDRGYSKRQSYLPTTTLHGSLQNGRASIANTDKDDYLLEATTNYTKTVGNGHKFDALIGVSQQKFINRFNSSTSTGFITDAFKWNNLGAGSNTLTPSSGGPENLIASYFGRVNYNYKSKYLFTATVRTDGASVFAANNKWATFPSAAIAWNVAEEPFFKGLNNVVSQLKLRLSYGQTGNASINSNAFAAYSAYPAWLSGSDVRLIGVSLNRLENPDLKWETTTGANFGVDYTLFNGKVDGSFEVFSNVISDLLATRPLNSYQEVNSIISNIGETQSKGIELTVNTRNIQKNNFQWKTSFIFSKYKDNWKERAPDWKPAVYESKDDPIRAIYSRISDGILQVGEAVPASQPTLKPGMIKIKDINGFKRDANNNPVVDANGVFLRTGAADGRIDDADSKLLGTSDPDFMAGITNILTYKNFSLNFDFNGLFGRDQIDPNFFTYGISAFGVNSNGYNALRTVKNRWTPENPSTTQPSSYWGFSQDGVGNFFRQDAWFIRLQNVSLGYTLPKVLTKVFSTARVHVDAQNLFVITPYTGIDPETDSYTAAYPNIRTFTMGLNLTF